jgi:hypothetical protein
LLLNWIAKSAVPNLSSPDSWYMANGIQCPRLWFNYSLFVRLRLKCAPGVRHLMYFKLTTDESFEVLHWYILYIWLMSFILR